jgi:hypothetical protein
MRKREMGLTLGSRLPLVVLAVLVLAALPTAAAAPPQTRLAPVGISGVSRVGVAVALSADGTLAVVGAPYDDGERGAAYVFRRRGARWQQVQKLAAGAPNAGTAWSTAVSANGDVIVLGAPYELLGRGAVYVFVRAGRRWRLAQRIGPPSQGAPPQLGWSVAVSQNGSTIVAGSPFALDEKGRASVFVRTAGRWREQAELVARGSGAAAGAGGSVALSADGTVALVGAPYDSAAQGAAYVFERRGGLWQQAQRLSARGSGDWGDLGASVALSHDGSVALVGAPLDGNGHGAAFAYLRSDGRFGAPRTLPVPVALTDGEAGLSVALTSDGRTAVVGAPFANGERGGGAVYALGRDWHEVARVALPRQATSGRVGYSVSVAGDGDVALLGAPADRGDRGAALLVARSGRTLQKLIAAGASGAARAGDSVALSADGTVAVLGAPTDDGGQGAAYLFSRAGSAWRQRQKLALVGAADPSGSASVAVAVSADGGVVVAGTPNAHGGAGGATIFVRAGPHWEKRQLLREPGNGSLGAGVAISEDGSTILVGAPSDHAQRGAAYVFVRAGGSWRLQRKLLADPGERSGLGTSVAIARDGATALLGAPFARSGSGAAYVFARTGSRWGKGVRLGVTSEIAAAGSSVAISGDGAVALVGAPYEDDQAGAAHLYLRDGSRWHQAAKLSPQAVSSGAAGLSVALSGNGTFALVAAPNENDRRGAAHLFERLGRRWREAATLSTDSGRRSYQSAWSVSLSAGGRTALLGAPNDRGGSGAAYVVATP